MEVGVMDKELSVKVWGLKFVKRYSMEHGRFDKTVLVAATQEQREEVISIAEEFGYELEDQYTELTFEGFAKQIGERDYNKFFIDVEKR
jgi:KaiC/GvpD/RAD55 family RecA-like ATPase